MASTMDSQKLFRLDGRTAFVSAARGHLGRAMTLALAEAGAHVIVNGRDDGALAAFELELKDRGFSAERAAFDAGDPATIRAYFSRLKRLDVLVNCAVNMQVKSFTAIAPEDFAATYASSVTAAFETVRAALPALKQAAAEAGEASVINVSSVYAGVSPDRRLYDAPEQQSPFHYGPAKAGVIQLSRHLAAELGPHRIRVNALVPSLFPHNSHTDTVRRLAERTMLGRPAAVAEIMGPLLLLASPAGSFITGSALTVDGGWTAW
jgi:NAD(P)-dependent dehydrogenase (short-subunit alcohol dehydrogenase family)